MKKYSDLLAKQFNEIRRNEIITNEETWKIFLKQKETQEIEPNNKQLWNYGFSENGTKAFYKETIRTNNDECQKRKITAKSQKYNSRRNRFKCIQLFQTIDTTEIVLIKA